MHSRARLSLLPEHGPQQASVGRTTELAALAELLGAARRSVRLVAVGGDPWLGKTRLLNDLIVMAAARGWTTAAGGARHALRDASYGVLTETLDGMICQDCMDVVDESSCDRACQLVQSLSIVIASARAGSPAEVAADCAQVDWTCRQLDTLGSGGRLLLVLDDVHWADEPSLDLLRHLAGRISSDRLLIVVAYRPRQAGLALRRLLGSAAEGGHAARVTPAPLTDEQAGALLPAELGPWARRTVLREAGGNPGLVRGLAAVRAWQDEPADPLPQELGAVGGVGAVGDVLVGYLRDFDALSERGWLIARSAAVLGDPFEPELLATTAQVARTEVWPTLDELIDSDLVRPDGSGRWMRFRDPVVRALAYRSAGTGWRLGAHARAAEELSARGGPAVALARHVQHSAALGDDASVRVLTTAAQQVMSDDPRQAESWVRTAIDLIGSDDDGLPESRLLLGEALAINGRPAEGLRVLDHVRDDGALCPATRIRLARLRTRAWRLLGCPEKADPELRSVLSGVPPGDATLRSCLHRDRLAVALEAGEAVDEALDAVRGLARDEPDPGSDPTSYVHTLSLVAAAEVRLGRTAQAEQRVGQAARRLGQLTEDDPVDLLDALCWLGVAAVAVGRSEIAAHCYQRGLDLAERRNLTSMVPRLALGLGGLALHDGQPAEAAEYAAVAKEIAADLAGRSLCEAAIELEKEIARAARENPLGDPGGRLLGLSRRELGIAVLVSDGRTNQQIATTLGLSHKTVETYLGRIFKKLAVSSRSEVATAVGSARAATTALPDPDVIRDDPYADRRTGCP